MILLGDSHSLNIPPRTRGSLFSFLFPFKFQGGHLPDCLLKMHARWSNLIALLLSLTLAVGCMTPRFSGDPLDAGNRQGFKNPAEGNGADAKSGVGSENTANPNAQATGAAGIVDPASAGSSEQKSAASEASIPPLGTAHRAQRAPGEGSSQASPEASKLAKSEPANEQEQALLEVLAELEAMGELDAETKQQLMADLRETKPALWQPILNIYRSALAKRKRGDVSPASGLPPEQVIASDNAPALEATSTVSYDSPPSGAGVLSKRSPEIHKPPMTPTLEAIPPAESVASRPSPVRPATGAAVSIPSPASEQSEYEVQPAQYETTADQYVSEPSLPLRQRDRNVRLATASSAEKSVNRKAKPAISSKREREEIESQAREQELADWQAYLEESILLLEEESQGPARTAEEVRRQAELRLLYLAGGDREAALRPIDGISTTQQEFWSESLFALSTYLDAESLPDGPRRAAEARRHLEEAVTRLGELSTLGVRNIAFCSKVNSYGIYETYPEDAFEPGQQVLLYAELENFKCAESATGFVTAVRSSYQIFDARGVRVDSHDFATTEETCRNRRRDFFMRYFIDLPERIYEGEYTLKITIEDMQGQTSGEATIPFKIKEAKK